MALSKSRRQLAVEDIEVMRDLVLTSAADLISDAELLAGNRRYPRAFALSVIAIEEASKLLILLECAKELTTGQQPAWPELYSRLRNHQEKLMANLLTFKMLLAEGPTDIDRAEALARVREMNGFKQDGFYVTIDDGGVRTPGSSPTFDADRTSMVLRLAKVTFNISDLLWREFSAKRAGRSHVSLETRYNTEEQ